MSPESLNGITRMHERLREAQAIAWQVIRRQQWQIEANDRILREAKQTQTG